MNGYWAVIRREIDERRLLLLGAAVLGGLPFAIALLPRALGSAAKPLELAAILALIGTGVTAVVLGSSVIARDLAERRLGFYFQRPLSGWAIWGGKVSATAALSLAVGALMVLPAVLANLSQASSQPADGWLALGGLGALLAILALAHAGSIVLRARSPWLLLDLAGALAVGGLLLYANGVLVRAGLYGYVYSRADIGDFGKLGAAAAGVAAALAAGAAQVLTARTDLRRGHRALSLALWSGLLAAALGFAAFVHWVTWVTPRDLRSVQWADTTPTGPWVAVRGQAAQRPGYAPLFLVDAGSGRFLKPVAGPLSTGRPSLALSADGRRALWLETQGRPYFTPSTVVLADLTANPPEPVPTVLSYTYPPEALALSPDGGRLAVVEEGRLNLYRLPDGKIVASAAIPRAHAWQRHLLFVDDGRVRLYQGKDESWPLQLGRSYDIFDLGVDTHGLVHRSHFEAVADWPAFEVSPDGRYLQARMAGRTVLLDVETGRVAKDLTPAEPGVRPGHLAFLADGRVAQVLIAGKARQVRLIERDSSQERRFPIPGDRPVLVGDLLSPGILVLARSRPDAALSSVPPRGFETLLLDLATGATRPLGQDLSPVVSGWWGDGPPGAAPHLFLRGHGLVRIDPQTGRETVIVPTGSEG